MPEQGPVRERNTLILGTCVAGKTITAQALGLAVRKNFDGDLALALRRLEELEALLEDLMARVEEHP